MNNNIFVWYSSAAEESGRSLAQLLGTNEHGKVPPVGFRGAVVCFGAKPGTDFQWQQREFRSIINDPRNIRKYSDRSELFKRLHSAGLITPNIMSLSSYIGYYGSCEQLRADPNQGLIAMKANGADAKLVQSDIGLKQAQSADNIMYLAHPLFAEPTRTRVFVLQKKAVVALVRDNEDNLLFARSIAAEPALQLDEANRELAINFILHLVENKFVQPLKTFWRVQPEISEELKNTAIAAASALEYDFCAVDMAPTGTQPTVLNVVSTPDLANHPAIHTQLQQAFEPWVKQATRSAKDILQEIAAAANEQEAAAIVAELRKARAAG